MFRFFGSIFLRAYLDENEWRFDKKSLKSDFLAVSGYGRLEGVYLRNWWPSVLRLVIVGLPFTLLGLFFLADPSLFFDKGVVISCLLGFFIFLSFYDFLPIYRNWPNQTPREVALFSDGIGWKEGNSIYSMAWHQVNSFYSRGGLLSIITDSGEPVCFHHSLLNTELGMQLKIACGMLLNPNRLVTCPSCGKENAPGASRCLFCLGSLPVVVATSCQTCGAVIAEPDDLFCRQCGAVIKS